MRIRYLTAVAPLLAAGLLAGTAFAGSNLYSSEEQARQVCGSDSVVWVDINHNRYYHAGVEKYGKGDGGFTCEKATHAMGYAPAKQG